ncbi:type II secretion system protein GspD, partial [Arcobacter sp. CECT 8985]|uniref:type II secretion system protein GspD n=1 Tax=Arcobacter sp. CECT 8985 TaxID=1935424 RepID=UPI00100ADF00
YKIIKKQKNFVNSKTIVLKNIDVNELYESLKNSKNNFLKKVDFLKMNTNNSITLIGKSDDLKNIYRYIKDIDKNNTKKLSKVISLKNSEGKNIIKIINDYLLKNKIKNLFASLDIDSNSIILIGNNKQIVLIDNLIHQLDKDETQIYLKAKIVELNRNLVKEIGFKYGLLSGKTNNSGIYTLASNLNSKVPNDFDLSSIGLSIPTLKSSLSLAATLSLLQENYALKIVSEPSILCINNKKSSIYIGETISLQTDSTVTTGGNTSYSYERTDIGLKLDVKPRVSENINKVRLNINAILEGIQNSTTNKQPDTTKKQINTSVIIKNGESVILGGLIENRSEKTDQNIPFFSSVPILGNLFKYKNKKNIEKNLVVVITPYIVPKSKDLTYIRNELSKLKSLEDNLISKTIIKNKKDKELKYKKLHKQRVKELLGI